MFILALSAFMTRECEHLRLERRLEIISQIYESRHSSTLAVDGTVLTRFNVKELTLNNY